MALKNLNVVIGADTTGFQKGLKTVQGGISKVKGGLSSLVKGGLALAGVTVGLKAIGDSMKAYVGLESSINRVNGMFGNSSKYIQYFAENTAKGFGIAESSAYQYAAIYGNLFRGITGSTEENAKVTIAMLKASAVVASKTGRTMDDVMERIRSGLLGNTEAIEDLGIYAQVGMIETTDAFKKIANGRSWEQLNYLEQQQIRTLSILEQAHTQFGDTVQTGSAYSLSVLSSAFKDLQSTAGAFINKALVPVVTWLTKVVQWASNGLKAIAAMLGIDVKGNLSNTASDITTGATGANDMAAGLDDSAKNAKKLSSQLAGFDKFNDITKTESGGNTSGSKDGGAAAGVFDGLEALEYGEIKGPDLTWVENARRALEPTITAFKNLWQAMDPFRKFAAQGVVDFYNDFLQPVGKWVLGEGLPKMIDALSKGFESVNWSKINTGLDNLWKALAPFTVNVGKGLLWFWENVLVPLGAWTLSEVVPRYLDTLSTAIKTLNPLLEGLAKVWKPIWDLFLKPVAEYTGQLFLDFWDTLNEDIRSFQKLIEGSTAFDDLKDILDDILPPLANLVKGLVLLDTLQITLVWQAIIKTATLLFKNLEDRIGFVKDILNGDFKKAWEHLKDLLIDNKIEFVTGLFEDLRLKMGEVIIKMGELINNWKTNLQTFVSEWDTKISDWWDNHVTKWFKSEKWNNLLFNIGVALGTAIAGFVKIWNTDTQKWWDNNVAPRFTKEKWEELFENMVTALSNKLKVFKTEWITKMDDWWDNNVVKYFAVGDWEGFGENMKNGIITGFDGVVKGVKIIINRVLTGFEKLINGIASGINKIIEGYNAVAKGAGLPTLKLLSTSFSLPRLELANGGIAYGEVQALVGDNFNARQNPEVIAPLSALKGMIIEALMQKEIATGGNGETRIILQLENGEILADMLIDPMNKKAKNLGYQPVFKPA